MKKFNYKYPGCFYAYGPIFADNEQEVRKELRSYHNLKKLTGFELWEIR